MECNRDEALRAKSIAEAKWEKKDFVGAKKFALKAQTLYPGLDGIHQMMETFDVYISAENKIRGEVDWYGVLGVNPLADEETIKKQFRKYALMLHPDKNKSVAADGAFKLISEAWTLLSDKPSRLAYNKRRSLNGFLHVPMHNSTSAPKANGHYNFVSKTTSVPKAQNNNVKMVPPAKSPAPAHKRCDTFWTICHRCKMHYEYVKLYLNSTLLCPNCKDPFMASETAPPFNNSKPTNHFPQQNARNHVSSRNASGRGKNDAYAKQAGSGQSCPNMQQNSSSVTVAYDQKKKGVNAKQSGPDQSCPNSLRYSNIQQNSISGTSAYDQGKNNAYAKQSGPDKSCPNSSGHANIQRNSISGTANVASTNPSIAVKAANVVQLAQDKLKRAYSESQSSTGWEAYLKKRKLDEDAGKFEMNRNMAVRHAGCGTSSASAGSKISDFSGTCHQPNSIKELTPIETRNAIIVKARKEILRKVNEWQSEAQPKSAVKEKGRAKTSKKEMHESINNLQEHNQNGNSELFLTKKAELLAKSHLVRCVSDNINKEDSAGESMNVPDPDFHDFDMDRTESSFEGNEVWAAYDDDDGMPRFYALIHKVISTKPFKLRISWLNSKTNIEFSSIDWVGSGFYKTCGEFRVGRHETCKSINAFSQKVNWTKRTRGGILILPQKGDVWALYRNWSSDWNEQTPDEVIHNYDIVTVLDDYSDERGISVAPLMKVVGFRTVFHQNLDPRMNMSIPKEEMLRFSHRVPKHLISGQEAQNAPAGCLELDPAATPLELLQVTKDANDAPVVLRKEKEKVNEQVLQSVQRIGSDEIAVRMNENHDVSIAENSGGHNIRKGTVQNC